MPSLPAELLVLVPLALAAGIDLYLALLVIALAPRTPWWGEPLPGALGDLDAPAVVLVLAVLYLAELRAERGETSALAWNACHTLIRPLSGGLLGALLLYHLPAPVALTGVLVAGTVAWLAHAVRSGRLVLSRWAPPTEGVHPLLASLLEDAMVVGLVALSLDRPVAALVLAVGVAAAGVPRGRSHVRALVFATRLAAARALLLLRQRAWVEAATLPVRVLEALETHASQSGGTVRGTPAAALRAPGLPLFATGWVVQQGRHLLFVHRRRWQSRCVPLEGLEARAVVEHGFFRAVDLEGPERRQVRLYFFVTGPTAESLAAAFSAPDRAVHGSRTVHAQSGSDEKNL